MRALVLGGSGGGSISSGLGTEWRLQTAKTDLKKKKKKKKISLNENKVSGRKAPPGADHFHRALISRFLSAQPLSLSFSGSHVTNSPGLILPPLASLPCRRSGFKAEPRQVLEVFSSDSPFPWGLQAPRTAPWPVSVSLGPHLLLNSTCL